MGLRIMPKPFIVCAADLKHLPETRRILETVGDVCYVDPTPQALREQLPRAHAYYASLEVRITAELMALAPNLKVIATPSTGLDHIDIDAAEQHHIKVLCIKYDRQLLDQITATAEMAWTLLLACARRLPEAIDASRQGIWARDRLRGHQIAYKTFGILGCGRLGTIVSQYAHAFRMRVLGCDTAPVTVPNVEMVSFDQLLAQSDVLSIHIHLTEENRKLINRQVFAKMKRGAILINTSRGAIIDETAMIEALDNGTLSAAGLDVIEGEWRKDLPHHPLIAYSNSHDNLIISPHLGGVAYEAQEMACGAAAQKLVDFICQKNSPDAS